MAEALGGAGGESVGLIFQIDFDEASNRVSLQRLKGRIHPSFSLRLHMKSTTRHKPSSN